MAGWGRVFPNHPYGAADGKMFNTLLTLSPAGDEPTLDCALELIDREGLGSDAITDDLAVIFSCADDVGHIFGPGRSLARGVQVITPRDHADEGVRRFP